MNEDVVQPAVYVVDDDEAMRDSIACLLDSVNLPSRMFGDASAFLEFCDPRLQGCILLDIRMPGMSGMELLESLKANGVSLPVIIITGHGDVPLAVRALKLGAFDFVQKPFSAHDLLERVHAALQQVRENRQKSRKLDRLRSHFDALTAREREIMELVVAGNPSKVIGTKLGISSRTVDIHRANIMRKLNIRTIAELVQNRLALRED
ncbi:MAG: response regulator transcription factor [Nitrosomonadales bacterium]|nr:response regulator transcription factor [Nitrosomonadales bacterium]